MSEPKRYNSVVFAAYKGGVGKTTAAILLALSSIETRQAYSPGRKFKTLLIDFDNSANATQKAVASAMEDYSHAGIQDHINAMDALAMQHGVMTSYDLLAESVEDFDNIKIWQPNDGLHVIINRGRSNSEFHDIRNSGQSPAALGARVRERIERLVDLHDFDLIVFDTGPDETNFLSLTAYYCATDVVVAVDGDVASSMNLESQDAMIQAISEEKQQDGYPPINIAGVLISNIDQGRENLVELRASITAAVFEDINIYSNHMPRRKRIREATSAFCCPWSYPGATRRSRVAESSALLPVIREIIGSLSEPVEAEVTEAS